MLKNRWSHPWGEIAARVKGSSGVTSIEYALLASLIAMVIVAAVGLVGDKVLALYESVVNAFQ
jgi:pilus assembly protein Flp/PilA